jgi:hypothetical protein
MGRLAVVGVYNNACYEREPSFPTRLNSFCQPFSGQTASAWLQTDILGVKDARFLPIISAAAASAPSFHERIGSQILADDGVLG